MKPIPLVSEQLAKEIPFTSSSGILHEDLFFLDPTALFTAFLRSVVCDRLHFGHVKFRDNPQKL
jgi:hypothetical protein